MQTDREALCTMPVEEVIELAPVFLVALDTGLAQPRDFERWVEARSKHRAELDEDVAELLWNPSREEVIEVLHRLERRTTSWFADGVRISKSQRTHLEMARLVLRYEKSWLSWSQCIDRIAMRYNHADIEPDWHFYWDLRYEFAHAGGMQRKFEKRQHAVVRQYCDHAYCLVVEVASALRAFARSHR